MIVCYILQIAEWKRAGS